jgi:hypothetical protein
LATAAASKDSPIFAKILYPCHAWSALGIGMEHGMTDDDDDWHNGLFTGTPALTCHIIYSEEYYRNVIF